MITISSTLSLPFQFQCCENHYHDFSGDDLSACIHTLQRNKKESFTYNQQISIMQGVMSAVEYLESNGLIHCDIKPHNVLFNV